jgi:hypothetical protein
MRFSEATGHKIVSTSTAATIGPVVWQQCSRYSPPNRVGTTLRRVAASRPCGRRTPHAGHQERSATPALVKIEIQSLNRLTSYARPFPQRCV